MSLNIPSVGKASTIDNNDINDNNNNNNDNKEDLNDYGAFNGSSSNIDLFDMNNYKPHREPRGIWLIASLITKLQEPCQTRILEHACEYFTPPPIFFIFSINFSGNITRIGKIILVS